FAFYTGSTAQKYKVVSAFYTDADLPLDTDSMLNFDNYHDYLEFVLNIKVRSLYQMPVDILEGDSFMTLVADADLSGDSRMVVVGRLVRQDEDAAVDETQITPADTTLQPAAYYTRTGTLAPQNLSDTYTYWQNWYLVQNMTNTDIQQQVTMPEIDMPDMDMPGAILPGNEGDSASSQQAHSGSSAASSSGSTSGSSSGGTNASASASTSASSKPASSAADAVSSNVPGTQPPVSASPPASSEVYAPDPSTEEMLTVTMNGTVMTDTATNILSMIVSSEMGTRWSEEAYKAQAVAAHSWIINQQNSGIAAPSVAGKAPTVPVIDAVSQVSNLVMRYNGAVIFAPYTASVAGATQNSADVWGGSRPYLVSVPSVYDSEASGFYGTVTIGLEEMRGILNAKVPGANLGDDPASWITIDGYTSGTYVGQMTIGGETTFYNAVAGRTTAINGRWFREAIVNGYGLRSAAFTVAFDGEKFLITTSGWGHGCGLSQWGAQFYATREGWNYQQILTHYYTGVSVEPY
ncbi:MAG: SpoIID/LytB domain-containing protein, partial [Oscillospiraceae bacterium]|nr:SpoIID/LytB domain-containing protein [Oscillospiraceae bacterium]